MNFRDNTSLLEDSTIATLLMINRNQQGHISGERIVSGTSEIYNEQYISRCRNLDDFDESNISFRNIMLNSEKKLQEIDRLRKKFALNNEISCDSASWYPRKKTGPDLDTPNQDIAHKAPHFPLSFRKESQS